tara:strand:+ start:257 stop:391 length:135 start_codon:yes stop_codon:yes gene_type:complete
MNIRCITIGSCITVQGTLIKLLADGLAIVDAGKGPQTGKLVGSA